ncbi:HAMP domain-containing histidine kinase [Pseudothauera nasutitermitis]|uniref:histidine kinase n=1 Tax=Pseudothauera nasutitermitis TaxID=2565930 RepID=A0A4S4AUJ9_9RHOO|nr:HAMP domain-containing sensor histidine kinase [Pseudothauera nasutitermitis]THF63568.1 HAMP domain-containing histidine kinase [Pseudothauera nasutitermitis]
MKTSLSRRLFRTLFAISLINVGVTLMVLEFVYEDMEETILQQELALERRFLEERITEARARTWSTALLNAVYIPDGDEEFELPSLFQGREIPFSAEVEVGALTFLISIERTTEPPGVLYLAQEITLMENREDVLQIGVGLFALFALGMVLLLARIGTRRVVGPLENLAREIARVRPGTLYARIQTPYADAELANIADTLNQLLNELDAYVQREKSLVSLASHELRTPVAVISGALDVLEQRDSLGEADRRTVARIRRAADEMHADVQTLLKLARRSSEHEQSEAVDLAASVRAVITDLSGGNPALKERIECVWPAQAPVIDADPALVRMLLRNLVQNAVRHTTGQVRIALGPHSLSIIDTGAGLPEHIRARLSGPQDRRIPEDGLGLFIVRLICERLGWLLQARRGDTGGTIFDLLFLPDAARAMPSD